METDSVQAPITEFLSQGLYWSFLGMLILNVIQRRHQQKVARKRMATLYLSLGLFAVFLVAQGILMWGGADWMLFVATAVVVAVLYSYRDQTFPFVLRSPTDGRRLTFDEILFDDNHGDEVSSEDADTTNPGHGEGE